MSSKRYQNLQKGYSRRQEKAIAAVAIEEELSLDEATPRGRFGPDSIVALMSSPPGDAGTTSPQSAVDVPGSTPESPAEPGRAAVDEVRRGAMAEVAHPTNARIRAFDRLMALIRRTR